MMYLTPDGHPVDVPSPEEQAARQRHADLVTLTAAAIQATQHDNRLLQAEHVGTWAAECAIAALARLEEAEREAAHPMLTIQAGEPKPALCPKCRWGDWQHAPGCPTTQKATP